MWTFSWFFLFLCMYAGFSAHAVLPDMMVFSSTKWSEMFFICICDYECVNSWERESVLKHQHMSWCSLNLCHHCDSNFFMMRCLWKYSAMSIEWKWYTVKMIIMIIQTTIINSIPIMEYFFVPCHFVLYIFKLDPSRCIKFDVND